MKKIFYFLLSTFHLLLFAQLCSAQYTVIRNCGTSSGDYAFGSLTVGDNELYGIATMGGKHGNGCIFSIRPDGSSYTDLHDFNGADGAFPVNSVWPGNTLTLQGATLYGTTPLGGMGYGDIFLVDTSGAGFRILYNFDSLDGAYPFCQPSISGNAMYGMTPYGGAHGDGCIFYISTNGSGFKDLYSFSGSDGMNPFGTVTVSGNNLYGMTVQGGAFGGGNVFSVKTDGSGMADLLDFSGLNGLYPQNSFIMAHGVLYGMTFEGGTDSAGNVFAIDTDGSNFKNIHVFSVTDGANPWGNLLFSDGVLYGITSLGGADSAGNIFAVDTDRAFTDLHDFTNATGSYSFGSLVMMNHTLFGMTNLGGTSDSGVIFSYADTAVGAGINQLKVESEKVKVEPNPSSGVFTVEVESGKLKVESANIQVFNVLGEEVYSNYSLITNHYSLDLSSQPNGIYFYRVIANNGNIFGEGKLVIQK